MLLVVEPPLTKKEDDTGRVNVEECVALDDCAWLEVETGPLA